MSHRNYVGVRNQYSLKSWFPLHNTWAATSPLNFWTDRNAFEFDRRMKEIMKGGQPLTATQWTQKMKANSHTRRLRKHNEDHSKRFIEQILSNPH